MAGGELFDAHPRYYDADTLEPLYPVSVTLERGELEGEFAAFDIFLSDFPYPWSWRGGRLRGTVAPSFRRLGGAVFAAHCLASELASVVVDQTTGRSALDVLVDPGFVLGVPGLSGVQPDLDLDGDGLETFVADAEGRVSVCIDGDGTTLSSSEGRPCALEPGIEDAISMTMLGEAVWARLLVPGQEGLGCPPSP
jgi:hypothetical protein